MTASTSAAYATTLDRLKIDPAFCAERSEEAPRNITVPGMMCLGSGCYGAVFAESSESPTVLKLGFKSSDPYPYYLKWVQECAPKDNPAFPKVLMLSIGEGYYAAELERLDDAQEHHKHGSPFDVFSLAGYFSADQRAPAYLQEAAKLIMEEAVPFIEELWGSTPGDDFHWGNVMVRRATGEYVITDPLC